MGESHDLMNLEWVLTDIEQSLKVAQEALEAYLEEEDSAQLQASFDAIHQVNGSLQMAGVPGAVMLAEHIQTLLTAMIDGVVSDREAACNALAQALLYMPSYLNRIKSDSEDVPALLHTVVNDVRAVLGQEPIDELALFNPNLGRERERASVEVKTRFDQVDQAGLRKLRQVYQFALIGLIRLEDTKLNTARLSNVLARLNQICQGAPINQLWEVATAFVEGLINEGVELNAGTLDLLRSLEKELKEFIHAGVFALDRQAHPVLMKGMLYWIAKSHHTGPHILSIRQAYDLDRYELGGAYSEKATLVAGPDPETFRTVAAALSEELEWVKDTVDLYMRSVDKVDVDIAGILPRLQQISSTLVMLNFEAPRLVVQEQLEALKAKLDHSEAVPETLLLQLAEALLFVEAELEALSGHVQGISQDVPPALVGEAGEVVVKEGLSNLRNAKETMHGFLAEGSNFEQLESVPATLRSAYGGLLMLSQKELAQLLLSASQYVEDDVLAQQRVPDEDAIEAFAEVLASVEFCLDGLAAQQPINVGVLERAKQQIAKLGYPIEQKEGISSEGTEYQDIEPSEDSSVTGEALDDENEVQELTLDDEVADTSSAQTAVVKMSDDNIEWDVPESVSDVSGAAVDEFAQTDTHNLSEKADASIETSVISFELEPAEYEPPVHERDWVVPEYTGDVEDNVSKADDLELSVDIAETLETEINDVDHAGEQTIVDEPLLTDEASFAPESLNAEPEVPVHERDWVVPEYAGENQVEEQGSTEPGVENELHEALADEQPAEWNELDYAVTEADGSEPAIEITIDQSEPLGEDDISGINSPEAYELFDEDDLIDEEILEIFTEEAGEVFEEIDRHWPAYVADPTNQEALVESRRAFHTLKGSGRMVKADFISELSWSIENMLNKLIEGEISASDAVCDLVNEVRLALPTLLDHFQAKTTPEIDVTVWMTRADQLAAGEGLESAAMEPVGDYAEPLDTIALDDETEEESDMVLYELFIKEAEQHLATLQDFIDEASVSVEPLSVTDDLYRALHTLKGSAKMASLDVFAAIAEPTEQLALTLVNVAQPVNSELQQAFRQAHEMMTNAVGQLPGYPHQPVEGSDVFIEQLLLLCQNYALVGAETDESSSELTDFIRSHVDSICDLTDGYEHWRQPTNESEVALSTLQAVAQQLAVDAESINLPPLHDLLICLAKTYEQLAGREELLTAEVIQTLDAANSALIQVFDEIAASQVVSETETIISQLQSALASADTLSLLPDVAEQAVIDADEEPDAELIEIFLEEAEEILEQASVAKQDWIDDRANAGALDELQRCLHTLKGGARMAGLMSVGSLSHELESLYEDVDAGKLPISEKLFDMVHACDDRIVDMLTELKTKLHCTPATELIAQVQAFRAAGGDLTVDDADKQTAEQWLERLVTLISGSFESSGTTAALAAIRQVLESFQDAAYQEQLNEAGDLCHIFREVLPTADAEELQSQETQSDLQDWLERLATALKEGRERLKIDPPPPKPVQKTSVSEEVEESSDTRKTSQDNVRVSASLLEHLVDLAGETSVSRSRVEQQVNSYGYAIDEIESTIERLREQLRRLENETETQILFRQEREGPTHEDFDPLEMDRYSRMQELSRALMESVSDLLDLKETLRDQVRVTENLLLQQSRTNTELHEGLMKARMVPFSRLVPRLRRLARQVGSELNKQVELSFKHPETELDRSLLEHMTAPLEHMLRNAIDHGVEATERREASGKPAVGQITLSLSRDGGDIVLELRDDGAGINIDKVKTKAIERGLMAADAKLTDHQILQFVLQQGFSTADKVTQISGRGVGMDVANSEVRQLGGSISIDSEPGTGTCFTVRLPFTVSISRAMMVSVGEDVFALPLNSIEGVVRVNPYELEEYFREDGPDFEYAGVKYELHYLGDFVERAHAYQAQGGLMPLPVILVRTSEHAIALQVDSISGSREVVVKPLGQQFCKVPGMSGATILGDGRVVLILDMAGMIREHWAKEGVEPVSQPVEVPAAVGRMQVMVVDDSVTVRKVASRLLERHGMEVILAKDGVEAMTKLQEDVPGIMLLDIEMPRMDGFELASLVRHDERLKDIPIIMISSRTGEKHQARARDIGVNRFMGKPFQEADLLAAISELTGAKFETDG